MTTIFFISLTMLLFVFSQIAEESGVWVLSSSNIDQAFSIQSNILIEFYAPGCGHCEKLAPEYTKAAQKLLNLNPPIHIGKVNGLENESLLSKYKIKGFPTLLYFIDGEAINYTGDRTEDSIFSFVYYKSRPKVTVISLEDELDHFLTHYKTNAVLFSPKDSKEFKVFETVSKDFDNVGFIWTESKKIAEIFECKQPELILLKNLRNERARFEEEFNKTSLTEFIKKNKAPIVMDFDMETISLIFKDNKAAILLLSDSYEKFKVDFETLSMMHKRSLLFVQADLNTAAEGRLASFLTLSSNDQPTAIIIDPLNNLAKYKIRGQLSYSALNNFINDWIDGKADKFLKSQPVPEHIFDKDNIRVLVGHNFKEVVFDEKFDVVVQFYSEYCTGCSEFNQYFVELANGKLSKRKGLVFAKVNMDKNDLDDFVVDGMPSMIAFTKDNKDGVVFAGDWIVLIMENFLEDVLGTKEEHEELNEQTIQPQNNHNTDL